MDVLILSSKEVRGIKKMKAAFNAKGFSKADYLNISKINLVSRGGRTKIVNGGTKVEDYDAVYLRTNLKMAPFVEPLLDELKEEGIYTQFRPGAYYVNSNEGLQVSVLNAKGLPVAKSVVVSDPKIIKDSTEKLNYPIIFKSFKGQTKIQSILIESPRSLRSIAKSIKMDLDVIILREFEEADLLQCAVIGGKVFAIRRRWNGTEIDKLAKGIPYTVSDQERYVAIKAARACSCEIATVKISRGNVTEVMPDINFAVFNQKTGVNLFEVVADYFSRRASGEKVKRVRLKPSLFDRITKRLEGVLNG